MFKRTSLSISARRHFVDNFFFSKKDLFNAGTRIVDIGGKKMHKRGLFDIDKYGAEVTYVNIESKDEPDIIADASNIPVANNYFDIAIMGEILEHLPDPEAALREAHRILKRGGIVLATVPFMVGIHADPFDYGRYTDSFWKKMAKDVGFESVVIERQGTIFAVMALMIQHIFIANKRSWRPVQFLIIKFLMWLDRKTSSPQLTAWTTGFGIKFVK